MQIDLNVSSVCNLGCRYCSEGKNPEFPDKSRILSNKTKITLEEIQILVNNIREKHHNEQIDFAFWGGEPFINWEFCKSVMYHFKDDKRTTFMFYSNGFYIPKYIDEIIELNNILGKRLDNNRPRLFIQISYDGKKVNDIERLTKNGKSTSERVLVAFKMLVNNNIDTSIKSTITPRTFKYMFDSFVEIINLKGSQNYFPTPDAFSDYEKEHFDEYFNDLKLSLMKIAKYIYDNKLPLEKFGWFRKSRALCQAGINYFSFDIDGMATPCHSTMYEVFSDHKIGNIKDIDLIEKFEKASLKYKDLLTHMNDSCTNCDVLYCMKCPAGCYNLKSNLDLMKELNIPKDDMYRFRWCTKNKNMCAVFKLNDVIYKSLLSIVK